MRIIANASTTHNPRYLVEMSEDEIAKLCGETYMTSLPPDQRAKIGMEYSVSDAWNDFRALREAKEKIEKAADILFACSRLAKAAGASYAVPEQPTS